MEFKYQYYGATQVNDTAQAQNFSFAPDLLRPPTRFDGTLKRDGQGFLQVREALSALHSVVVSDMRTRGRDSSAYREWLQAHEAQLLAGFMADTGAMQQRSNAITAELKTLRDAKAQLMGPFYKAQRQYFDWLYQHNRDLWYVLDPVITVHPDRLLFEAFSQDESSYCAVSIQHAAFEHAGEMVCGTTNIDYSASLYEEFQKIRNYKDTRLQLDPAGLDVSVGNDPALREEKIDLPDSWLRGFLQVSSAMALPATVVELHPMDLFNICAQLRRQREKHGPRSLRFELAVNEAPQIVFEPWNKRLHTKRSQVRSRGGAQAPATIRIWGRRRLLTLERLIAQAKSVQVHLLGSGMPSFWVIDMGLVTVTLGLSGWSANDWATSARFHLLAPQAKVRDAEIDAVAQALQSRWQASAHELAETTGLTGAQVHAAMTGWMQAGRAVYDLASERYAWRELLREPLTAAQLQVPTTKEEEAAFALLRNQQVPAPTLEVLGDVLRITGRIARDGGKRWFEPQLQLTADEHVSSASCNCNFFLQNRLNRGPCQHILAVRLAAQVELDKGQQTHWPPVPAQAAASFNTPSAVQSHAQSDTSAKDTP